MKRAAPTLYGSIALVLATGTWLLLSGQNPISVEEERIWQHRNLGKAFFENPTTQLQAVDEFSKALDLAPDSSRERLNYALALLRAGKMEEGMAELQKVQQQDPALPHTWFNLGIVYKKEAQYERAVGQFEQMVALVPGEPVSHYNLGVLYKLTGRQDGVLEQFETAARLNPNLAGPHFQLANTYRALGRTEEAERELKIFQEIKKRQAGAAVPEDLEWSTFAEIYDVVEPGGFDAGNVPRAALEFEDIRLAGSLGAGDAGLALLDADGDGNTDFLFWSGGRVGLYRSGSEPVENSGLANLRQVVSVAPGDFNNDGLADLCVLTESGATLYLNDKGAFQEQVAEFPFAGYSKAIWNDYDHDGDVDLFLLGEKCSLLRNDGAAGFSDVSGTFPFAAGRATGGVVFDLVKDTSVSDLILVYHDRAAVLYRDRLAGRYETVPLDFLPAGALSIVACDLDNDGWTDLAAHSDSGVTLARNRQGSLEKMDGPAPARGPILFADLDNRGIADLISGLSLHENEGLARFSGAKDLAADASALASAAADFDGDGRVDVAYVAVDGSLHLLKNRTATTHRWIGVSLLGVRNPRLAPGAQVEVKAGALYQKKIYRGIPLLFGLHSQNWVDTVRITWPNLLIQNETQQPVGRAERYREKQRLSGSCPSIFAWNGRKFEFITDVLGVAPLGVRSGQGRFFPADHEEYIQIPGEALAPTGDHYEIRITEELREVAYIDRVRLFALDHPTGTEVFTNDKFQAPPFPPLRLFGVKRRLYPVAARDGRGRDVLSRVIRRDRVYPDGFVRDYTGVAEQHSLELDFGRGAAPDNRAILVLNGWLDWADGSAFLRASQENREGLFSPYLQVKDTRGEWVTVIEDLGVPAGKPKTIVADLSGKFLSSSREIRIVTRLCVYWDEIFLSEETAEPEVRLSPLETAAAELRFAGFSAVSVDLDRKQPEWFDYHRRTAVSMWNPTPGLYTRYGEVRELLEAADDRFAIMGSGDELRFLFSTKTLPPLRPGYRRDFVLQVDGWAKDGDLNTAFSQTVEPLPFQAMTSYPYPAGESYPDGAIYRDYRQRYNVRPALRLLRPLNEGARRLLPRRH
ncbi:MAG: VCBS repeat-containing protein [Acidobacteria bacterium]|nr:VCBS repeat-containing protein [Acidobacteriota bacterium]